MNSDNSVVSMTDFGKYPYIFGNEDAGGASGSEPKSFTVTPPAKATEFAVVLGRPPAMGSPPVS